MQFIDRIVRPCGSGAAPFVSAIAASDGDFDITTCTGRSVYVNGVPLVITPGGGLGDPGGNGYVVRTALNTTVARTFTVGLPLVISNATGVAGNTGFTCPTCVTSAAALNSTALMTGAGLQTAQTPAATATLLSNGNFSTPGSVTTGNAGGVSGSVALSGATSGTVGITVAAIAGTWTLTLPIDDGTPGQFLQTDGSGVTNWQTVSAGTTINATDNVLPKRLNAGAFTNSRVSDDGTTITANSGAGVFFAGDTTAGANGSFVKIDDANKVISISADDNHTGVGLFLNGTNTTVQLTDGSGNETLQLNGVTTVSQLGGAGALIELTQSSQKVEFIGVEVSPITNGVTDLGNTTHGYKQVFLDATITAGGTTGAQTINKSAGAVNFAAAATSLVITSNKVTANSIVICTVATNDTTLKSVQCVPTAGSFTMFANAAATAETRVNFWILNQ